MSLYRIAWFFLICLINESSALDKVSEGGLETRSEEIVHTDKTSVNSGWGWISNIAKVISDAVHGNLAPSVDINVENLLSHKLTHFQSVAISGKLESPTMEILPQKTGTVKARSGTIKFFKGTSGVVSWEIEGQNVRIIVMWRLNAFKTNDSQKNTLWIALVPVNSFEISDWQKYVENDAEFPAECSCKKGIFTSGKPMNELLTTLGSFQLQGMLGTGKHPAANIILSLKKEIVESNVTVAEFL